MSSYAESAVNGNWTGMVRYAILNGSLWAVGSAWSTAIRAIVLEIVPQDATDIVLGELLAAASTTVLAVVVSFLAMRKCCESAPVPNQKKDVPVRPRRRPTV